MADAYDAMTSRRSYRDILPQAAVRSEIERGKGTQFDPVLADIMLEIIDEDTGYNTILNLKSYHLWVSFPSWRCFIPVNVALLRLPPFSLARAKNPSQI